VVGGLIEQPEFLVSGQPLHSLLSRDAVPALDPRLTLLNWSVNTNDRVREGPRTHVGEDGRLDDHDPRRVLAGPHCVELRAKPFDHGRMNDRFQASTRVGAAEDELGGLFAIQGSVAAEDAVPQVTPDLR